MSLYISSVNVIYNPLTDKIHTTYIMWKNENASRALDYIDIERTKLYELNSVSKYHIPEPTWQRFSIARALG